MKAFALTRTKGGSVLLNTLSSSWTASKRLHRGRCHAPAATSGHPALSAQIIPGRTYAAAVSPESMPIMAQLGVGLLRSQKPWDIVQQDFALYHQVYRETNGTEAPPPFCGGFFFVDENADRAEEMAYKHIGAYYHTAMKHYEMTAEHFGTQKGYEFYRQVTKHIGRLGRDRAAQDFARLMPWGRPHRYWRSSQPSAT